MNSRNLLRTFLGLLGLSMLIWGMPEADAQSGEYPQITKREIPTGLSAADLNPSATTSCMKLGEGRILVLDHDLVRNTSTAVETKCAAYRSADCADTRAKEILSCTGASCDQYKPSVAIAASRGWVMRFDVAGLDYAKCTFTATSGSATDDLTVRAFITKE